MDAPMPPETKHLHIHGIENAASDALDLLRDTTLEREPTPGRERKEPKAYNTPSFFEKITEIQLSMEKMKGDHIQVLEQIQKFNSKAKKDLKLSNRITDVTQNIQSLTENIQKLEQLVTKIESKNPMLTQVKHGLELSKMTTADGKPLLNENVTLDSLLTTQHQMVLSTQININEITKKLQAFEAQKIPAEIEKFTQELTGIKNYISLLESKIKKYLTATIGTTTALLIGVLIWLNTHKA